MATAVENRAEIREFASTRSAIAYPSTGLRAARRGAAPSPGGAARRRRAAGGSTDWYVRLETGRGTHGDCSPDGIGETNATGGAARDQDPR